MEAGPVAEEMGRITIVLARIAEALEGIKLTLERMDEREADRDLIISFSDPEEPREKVDERT